MCLTSSQCISVSLARFVHQKWQTVSESQFSNVVYLNRPHDTYIVCSDLQQHTQQHAYRTFIVLQQLHYRRFHFASDLSRCQRVTHQLHGHIILSVERERERLGEWGTHCVRPLMNLDTVQFKLPIRQLGSGAAIVFINYPAITWGDSFASDSRLVYVFWILNNPSMKERIWNVHQSWINLNQHEKAFKEKNEHNGDNRMLDLITGAKCQHRQKNNTQQNALLFSHWCSVVL